MNSKGQLSLEMIIIMGVIIAVIALLLTTMKSTGEEAQDVFKSKAQEVFNGLR